MSTRIIGAAPTDTLPGASYVRLTFGSRLALFPDHAYFPWALRDVYDKLAQPNTFLYPISPDPVLSFTAGDYFTNKDIAPLTVDFQVLSTISVPDLLRTVEGMSNRVGVDVLRVITLSDVGDAAGRQADAAADAPPGFPAITDILTIVAVIAVAVAAAQIARTLRK